MTSFGHKSVEVNDFGQTVACNRNNPKVLLCLLSCPSPVSHLLRPSQAEEVGAVSGAVHFSSAAPQETAKTTLCGLNFCPFAQTREKLFSFYSDQ